MESRIKALALRNVEITDELLKRELLNSLMGPIIRDLLFHDFYSHIYGFNLLTDRMPDLIVREKFEIDERNKRASNIMKGLTHAVPNIENISLKDLIKLRYAEEESLRVYRDSVEKALNEVLKGASDEEIISIFKSEIQPELNNLDMIFKKEKNKAVKSLLRSAIVSTGFISMGLFSGLFPANIGQLLAALGGYEFLDGLSKNVSDIVGMPEGLETSKYYFLWRVKKIGERQIY